MRDRMLRFDTIAYVGRFGAPHSASSSMLPRTWTAGRELEAFLTDLSSACVEGLGLGSATKGKAPLYASALWGVLGATAMYTAVRSLWSEAW